MNKFKNELSIRSINGLAHCFDRQTLDTPEVIAEAGAKRLHLVIGLGRKSIKEIAEVLYKFGFVDSIDDWLER